MLNRALVTIPAKDWEAFEAWINRPAEVDPRTGRTGAQNPVLETLTWWQVTPPRPLAEDDDRTHFDCGRDSLNIWFQRHAWANQASGASRVNIVTEPSLGQIVGYVTLSAAQIERSFLPKSQQRNRPDPVRSHFSVSSEWIEHTRDRAMPCRFSCSRSRLPYARPKLSAAWASSPILSTTICVASMRDGVLPGFPSIQAGR